MRDTPARCRSSRNDCSTPTPSTSSPATPSSTDCAAREGGPASSATLQAMVPRMLEGALDGHPSSIAEARKNAAYFRALVQSGGLNSVMSDALYQSCNQAVNLGYGEAMLGALFALQEHLGGISVVPRSGRRQAS